MDARMQIALPILGTVAADAAAAAAAASAVSFSELREVSLNIVVISFLFNQSSIKYNYFIFVFSNVLFIWICKKSLRDSDEHEDGRFESSLSSRKSTARRKAEKEDKNWSHKEKDQAKDSLVRW